MIVFKFKVEEKNKFKAKIFSLNVVALILVFLTLVIFDIWVWRTTIKEQVTQVWKISR